MATDIAKPRVLVVGGGYVGMYAALRLQKKLSPGEATITVVDPQPNMTYQPFLPEAAGAIEARQFVVPLRRVLRRSEVLAATVEGVDHGRRVATLHPSEGEAFELPYDVLVMAPGSVSRALPIPGLAEVGIGFKTIGEAVHLRNHILSRLDVASTEAPVVRRQRLDDLPYKVRGEAEPQQRTRRRGLVEAHLRGRLFVYPQHLLRLRGWGMEARLGREEYDLFMPGIPYEEFVEAQ